MNLAKPRIDVGLFTDDLAAPLPSGRARSTRGPTMC